jgi:hypothetical protein
LQERFGESLTVFMDKLDQERERGDVSLICRWEGEKVV